MTVCAEQASGDLSPNTAILVQVVTYDIPGSQAEGNIMYMIIVLWPFGLTIHLEIMHGDIELYHRASGLYDCVSKCKPMLWYSSNCMYKTHGHQFVFFSWITLVELLSNKNS